MAMSNNNNYVCVFLVMSSFEYLNFMPLPPPHGIHYAFFPMMDTGVIRFMPGAIKSSPGNKNEVVSELNSSFALQSLETVFK